MPLEAPNLDTRTYAEIRESLLARIPRFTPEWTDFNASDPGITLIELFAWLSESLLFQMNRLPELNYVKFLQLLNLELRPALPAVAHLQFTPRQGAVLAPVVRGTQVAAQSADDGQLIVFETDAGFDMIPHPLESVQVFNGAAFTVMTEANGLNRQGYFPFGRSPQPGNALYLGFTPAADLPSPAGQSAGGAGRRAFPQQIRLRLFLPEKIIAGAAQPIQTDHNGPPTMVRLRWEYRHRQPPHPWRPLTVFEDQTNGITREGYIVIEGPAEPAATLEGRDSDAARYWLRCRLDSGQYPDNQVPEIDGIRANLVSATALTTVRDEILGISEGHPDQSFPLRFRPVEASSFVLQVQIGSQEATTWERVDDFLASGPDDPHYRLNATAGTLTFGDGRNGRIPVAEAEIIARYYRHGGGSRGNVPEGQITIPLGPVSGVDSVSNPRPAVGGRDEQSLDELKREAPQALRHRNRAVTEEDFTELARLAGGVSKARAIALCHPDYPEIEVAGAVTVSIVPQTPAVPPIASSELITHVCDYLNQFRLIGTEVYVKSPQFVAISVQTRVAARPFTAFGKVEAAVRAALNIYLNPQRWPFGFDLYPTQLYGVILAAEGVAEVLDLALLVDGLPVAIDAAVVLAADGLVYGVDHQVAVVEREDL